MIGSSHVKNWSSAMLCMAATAFLKMAKNLFLGQNVDFLGLNIFNML